MPNAFFFNPDLVDCSSSISLFPLQKGQCQECQMHFFDNDLVDCSSSLASTIILGIMFLYEKRSNVEALISEAHAQERQSIPTKVDQEKTLHTTSNRAIYLNISGFVMFEPTIASNFTAQGIFYAVASVSEARNS
jgi:hypothetical protein